MAAGWARFRGGTTASTCSSGRLAIRTNEYVSSHTYSMRGGFLEEDQEADELSDHGFQGFEALEASTSNGHPSPGLWRHNVVRKRNEP